MQKDLQENWNLRNDNYKKDVLFGVIMREFGDMEVEEKNPILFKYYADIWWERKYRTFEKWWNGYDLSYDPLINNWFKEDRVLNESEQGNKYNKFKNLDSTTDHHIGDSFENRDYHNEYEDNEGSEETIGNKNASQTGNVEITDGTTSNEKKQASTDNTITSTIKDGKQNEVGSETKDTNTTSSISTDVFGANFNNEHSGGATGSFKNEAGDLDVTEQDDKRTIENKVSAYNSSEYEPSNESITKGDISNEARNTSHTKVYGDGEDNLVAEVSGDTKDTTYSETSGGTESKDGTVDEVEAGTNKQTVTNNEITSATDDTEKKFSDEKHGENTDNTQTTANNKSIDNSEGVHSGDSQEKNTVDRTVTESSSKTANAGVMTSQALLEAEVKVQNFDIYNAMAELFADDNLICIYAKSKGGCCLW